MFADAGWPEGEVGRRERWGAGWPEGEVGRRERLAGGAFADAGHMVSTAGEGKVTHWSNAYRAVRQGRRRPHTGPSPLGPVCGRAGRRTAIPQGGYVAFCVVNHVRPRYTARLILIFLAISFADLRASNPFNK